eukprot:SAG22_NODE_14296_length_378_cov_1.845878_1_plen_64_part_10
MRRYMYRDRTSRSTDVAAVTTVDVAHWLHAVGESAASASGRESARPQRSRAPTGMADFRLSMLS